MTNLELKPFNFWDDETKQEVTVTVEMLKHKYMIEQVLNKIGYLKGIIFRYIVENKLYLAWRVSTMNDFFNEYCDHSDTTGWRYIKIARHFERWLPRVRNADRHFVPQSGSNDVFGGITAILEEPEQRNEKFLEVFSKTSVVVLEQIARMEIDPAPMAIGGTLSLPSGERLPVDELPNTTLDRFKELANPKPQVYFNQRPLVEQPAAALPGNEAQDAEVLSETTHEDMQREQLAAIERLSRHLEDSITRFQPDAVCLKNNHASITACRLRLEKLAKAFSQEALTSKTNRQAAQPAEIVFYDISFIAEELELSERQVRKIVDKMDPSHVQVNPAPGGKKYMINPFAMPAAYVKKWEAAQQESNETEEEIFESSLVLEKASSGEIKRIYPYLDFLKQAEGLKGKRLVTAMNHYNALNKADLNEKTLYRYMAKYKEGGIAEMLPKWGKRAGITKVDEDIVEVFCNAWLSENQPSKEFAREQALGSVEIQGRIGVGDDGKPWVIDTETGEFKYAFPTTDTLYRLLCRKYTANVRYLKRYGAHKLKQTAYAPMLSRDATGLPAGSGWVSDHRQLDIICASKEEAVNDLLKKILKEKLDEVSRTKFMKQLRRRINTFIDKKGKPGRLWFTAWMDIRTRKWLGWNLHFEDPNSEHIFESFAASVEQYGLPDWVLLDNGKDYRCTDFGGGRRVHHRSMQNTEAQRSLLNALGVSVHHAEPYQAQVKPIEREFLRIINRFEKVYGTYTGKNASERPEITSANVKKGRMPLAEDIIDSFGQFLDTLNEEPRDNKVLNGHSANSLWMHLQAERPMKKIGADQLVLLRYRSSSVRKIKTNGFIDSKGGHLYYADWMQEFIDRSAYIRRPLTNPTHAYVFCAETDRLLNPIPAALMLDTAFMAQTDEERADLAERLDLKKSIKKNMQAQASNIKQLHPDEAHANFRAAVEVKKKLKKAVGMEDSEDTAPISRIHETDLYGIVSSMQNYHDPGDKDLSGILPPSAEEDNDSDMIYPLESDRP